MAAVSAVAYFGGSFTPPHKAHDLALRFLLESEQFEKVLLVPTGQNPLKDETQLTRERRKEMVLSWLDLCGHSANPKLQVIWDELVSTGPSFTVETIEGLCTASPQLSGRIHLCMGADSFASLKRWHRVQDLLSLSYGFLVFPRDAVLPTAEHIQFVAPKYVEIATLDLPALSSTHVRSLAPNESLNELAHPDLSRFLHG